MRRLIPFATCVNLKFLVLLAVPAVALKTAPRPQTQFHRLRVLLSQAEVELINSVWESGENLPVCLFMLLIMF